MSKKYIVLALLLWICSMATAQVMLPAYQGAFSKKSLILTSASNGLDFDGVDDYVINNSLVIDPSLGFTIEGWMKINDLGYSALATQTLSYLPAPFDMYVINGDGRLGFLVGQSSVTGSVVGSTVLTIGVWTHTAFVYDPAIGKVIIYVNGVQDGIESASPPGNVVGSKFIIGNRDDMYTGLNGTLDDIRIWNVARTQSQIQANMNKELLGNETGLKAYYPFNQGIAAGDNTVITTANDLTVNATNGTLTNFAKTGTTSNFVVGKVQSSIITNGLVFILDASNTASYPGSGSVWNDISGNNNVGNLVGPTYSSTVNSLPNPSIYFNGNAQYVDFGTSPTNFPTGDISVSVWIYFSALSNGGWNIFLTKWFPNSYDFHYCVKYNGASYKQNLYTNLSSNTDMYGASEIIANRWVCLGFTLKNGGDLQFYANGIPDGKYTTVTRVNNTNSILYLGDYRVGNPFCFNGYLSGVSLYNRTLSQDEMLNNYNAVKSHFGY